MREILFRGQTKSKEWVEGYYEKKPNGKTYILNRCTDAPDGDPMWRKVLIEHEVIAETVCQYTGLTDKNGKKIFEGDIVSNKGKWEENIGVIVFKTGKFVVDWRIHNSYSEKGISLRTDDVSSSDEVIGNIFGNPDLITPKKGAGA